MWRRNVLAHVDLRDPGDQAQDDDEFMLAAVTATVIPDSVYCYRIRPASMLRTTGATDAARSTFIALEREYAARFGARVEA